MPARPLEHRAGAVLALAVAYVVLGKLGLMFDAVSGFASLVWPPTGLSLACLLRFGSRLWPGVFIGALAVNVWSGAPVAIAGAIAAGNALEAVLGAAALRRVGFRDTLDRMRDVIALIGLAAVGCTIVSATAGVSALFLGGIVPARDLGATWRAWWVGDLMGALVVAPPLLVMLRGRATRGRWIEGGLLALVAVAATGLVFGAKWLPDELPVQQPHLLLPVLIWSAVRFAQRGAAFTIGIVSVMAVLGTTLGSGPFVRAELNESLLHLQMFVGVTAATILTLGAAVAERERARADQLRAEADLQRNYSLLRAVTEGTTDAVFVKDRGGRYLLINSAGAEQLGRTVDEVVGADDAALMPDSTAKSVMDRDRQIMAAGEIASLEELVPIDGAQRTFLSIKGPFRDARGDVCGLVGIARDITDRKRLESDLREAVRARDEFLSVASHELRTPLTALKLQIETLQRGLLRARAQDPATVARKVDMMARQADRLTTLVDRLLNVSRISGGSVPLELEELDLLAVVVELVDSFADEAARTGSSISVSGDSTTGRWDRSRLEQALANLISNALKYGAGRPIDIRVTAGGGSAAVTVRDHGIGVAAEDLSRIFGRFERAVSSKHYGGLGLGLYITRQIAEAHGGRIAAQGSPGQGATFTLELPREPERTPEPRTPRSAPGASRGPKE